MAGLPDGIFSSQKSQFLFILGDFEEENFNIFYGHLVYIVSIWYILCSFYIFVTFWYIFAHLGMFYQSKSGNTV
jgi:hypothetical protein